MHSCVRSRAFIPAFLVCTLICPVQNFAAVQSISATSGSVGQSVADADRLLREGHAEQVIELLLPLSAQQPPMPGVEAKLGKAYYEMHSLELAAQHLGEAFKLNPSDWESAQLLAIASFGLGQAEKAESLLVAVIPHLPEGQADAEHLLGICYLRTKDFDSARRAFARMFAVQEDGAMAHFLLAKMMVGQKMDDLALPQLQKALELDPQMQMAHFMTGEINSTRGDFSTALAEFQKELILNPSLWLVYWREGEAFMHLQRYPEAEQALKQSLWLNDSFTGGYLMLGEVELDKDDPNLARGFLERAVQLDPQNEYAHFFLGRAYQKLGMLDQSRLEFEKQKVLRDAKHEPSARLQ